MYRHLRWNLSNWKVRSLLSFCWTDLKKSVNDYPIKKNYGKKKNVETSNFPQAGYIVIEQSQEVK